MCGNGARCLARFARQAGFVDEMFCFETDADAPEMDVINPKKQERVGLINRESFLCQGCDGSLNGCVRNSTGSHPHK